MIPITPPAVRGTFDLTAHVRLDYAQRGRPPCTTPWVTHWMTQGVTQSVTQGVTQSVTQSVTESVTQGVTQSVTESVTQGVTQSVTESITESVTESVTQGVTRSVTESVTQGITQSVTGSVTGGMHTRAPVRPTQGRIAYARIPSPSPEGRGKETFNRRFRRLRRHSSPLPCPRQGSVLPKPKARRQGEGLALLHPLPIGERLRVRGLRIPICVICG